MPEVLRLFIMCEAMNWTHLPEAGGLYDQRPDLLDGFLYIWGKKGEHDRMEEAKKPKKKGTRPARRK